jgi:TRAP-type C4-dicarboxylate transport system permease large subunit
LIFLFQTGTDDTAENARHYLWFEVCVILACTLGTIIPPVAFNIFALKGIAKDIPIGTMYAGITPFCSNLIDCAGRCFLRAYFKYLAAKFTKIE